MTTTSIVIDRPADEVYDYVTDPTRFHQWQQGVVSGGLKEPGRVAVGSHCQMVRRIGGADRPSNVRGDEGRPADVVGRARHRRPDRALVDVSVRRLGVERTEVTIDVDFQGHGIGKLLVPLLVRRQAAKEMPTNLQRLKQRLELPPT